MIQETSFFTARERTTYRRATRAADLLLDWSGRSDEVTYSVVAREKLVGTSSIRLGGSAEDEEEEVVRFSIELNKQKSIFHVNHNPEKKTMEEF